MQLVWPSGSKESDKCSQQEIFDKVGKQNSDTALNTKTVKWNTKKL